MSGNAARRILVVEDNHLIGLLLGEMLEELGHIVCGITATEQDAVAAAAEHNPDLIIADARLGQGSGLSAVATILQRTYVPHIFMSGDLLSLRALRPDAIILRKPFQRQDLIYGIDRALNTPAVQTGAPSA